MKTTKLTLAIALTAAFGFAAYADDTNSSAPAAPTTPTLPPASTKTGVTFDTDIKPIFMASCMPCHSSTGPRKPRGGIALDTLDGAVKGGKDGPILKVGDSAHSDVVMSVAHIGDDPDGFMPKGKNAKQLTPDQIGLIRAWIDQGAK